MRIAFVNQPWNNIVPPVQAGSIAILTYEIARRLADDHDVIIYAKKDPGQPVEASYENVRYRRVTVGFDRYLVKVLKRLPFLTSEQKPLFSRTLYYIGYMIKIARDLRRQRCDVVHLHNFSQFLPIVRAFNPRIKILIHMHCEWLTQLDKSMTHKRLQKGNMVVAVCDYITTKIAKRFPDIGDRCRTVHNGVNLEQFSPRDGTTATDGDSKRVLFVGRLSPEKGIHVLIDAFKIVLGQFPHAHLDIVGPRGSAPTEFIVSLSDDPMVSNLSTFYTGSYYNHLENQITPDIADRVALLGTIPHEELIDHLRGAYMFMHPSVWGEPFPLAVLESLAAGVPVIASRAGGLVESVTDGETGILVEPDNAVDLANAILRLLKDEDLRNTMAKAARQRAVDVFSWDRVAKDFLALYEEMHTS